MKSFFKIKFIYIVPPVGYAFALIHDCSTLRYDKNRKRTQANKSLVSHNYQQRGKIKLKTTWLSNAVITRINGTNENQTRIGPAHFDEKTNLENPL